MTNKQFRTLLKLQHDQDAPHIHRTFAMAKTAKATYPLWQQDFISEGLRKLMDHITSILNQWDDSLGNCKKQQFIPATRGSLNQGVHLPDRSIKSTSHHFFVNGNIYCDNFYLYHIWQAVEASIKAIYILLGDWYLMSWQDPVSFNKLEDTPISNKPLILLQIWYVKNCLKANKVVKW